jgi:hypothetical protein
MPCRLVDNIELYDERTDFTLKSVPTEAHMCLFFKVLTWTGVSN